MSDSPTPEKKQLPPWAYQVGAILLSALLAWLGSKYGTPVPPVVPAPQAAPAQPLVIVVGQPATASPVAAAAK